ncbi:hypothetical protein AB9N12_05785 [Bacteroides sp. AN502(2024)]|uniref:hypothetical protein n=1 Tax=Bacteroides sp. AN502(2024) TaxID=3160599 RepID=UPI0035179B94
MASLELAAFGTDMVVAVRIVACRLPVGKPMCHDSFTTFFSCHYFFCRKEKQNPSPNNGLYYYRQHVAQGGRGWHRLEVAFIILTPKIRKVARAGIRA